MDSFITFTKKITSVFYIIDKFINFNDDSDSDSGEEDVVTPIQSYFFIKTFLGVCNFIFHLLFSPLKQSTSSENLQCNDDKKKLQRIDYTFKYDDKFSLLEKESLTDEVINNLSNNIVMEYTPNGNVIMFFDNDKKSFQYYSDFNIPYSYLESVSKKYCIVYKNSIFRNLKMDIDVNNEFALIKNKSSRPKSKSFATLKTYNNGCAKPSNGNGIPIQPTHKGGEVKIIQKDIVRYTHLGKLSNFSFLKNTQPKHRNISYKDFIKN
jgi:hypothetical protein